MFIAPHATEDDVVFLTTLEGIHGSHLYLLVEVFLQRTIVLHIIDDVRTLSFVRGHNAYLARNNAGLEEFRDNFLNV